MFISKYFYTAHINNFEYSYNPKYCMRSISVNEDKPPEHLKIGSYSDKWMSDFYKTSISFESKNGTEQFSCHFYKSVI